MATQEYQEEYQGVRLLDFNLSPHSEPTTQKPSTRSPLLSSED